MIKPIEMYKVICDRCEADAFRDDEYSCWHAPDYAVEMAENGDWQTFGDKHYCPNCLEWNETADEVMPKAPIEK